MDYLNLLVDTKKEFTTILVNNMYPEIYIGLFSIFNSCKQQFTKHSFKLILPVFQGFLQDIPKWNNNIINKETHRIKTKCTYLDDLLSAVFISNIRLLCSIKNNSKKIKIKVPRLENFIHKCYIETAREFWKSTYLFNQDLEKIDIQKNNRHIEYIIKTSIEEVIRKFLPIKYILKDYLETNLNTETEIEPHINTNLADIINNNTENNHQKDHTPNDNPQKDHTQNDKPQNDKPQNDESQNDESQKNQSQKAETQKDETRKTEPKNIKETKLSSTSETQQQQININNTLTELMDEPDALYEHFNNNNLKIVNVDNIIESDEDEIAELFDKNCIEKFETLHTD
tara:strand:+ start:813 stop:1838 length:1026 start_codon:yes stop_codon:yes gene_type:complete